ncbi:MAG: DivIVA domain-containing protein [Candidatus Aminicenantes bacterium]|nr:DivIVA domain-containing protein [Candidatus Aminicenantes bacterium]
MKITPQDIRTQQFNAKFKGYDKEEVSQFLDQVSKILEEEILEKGKIKKELEKAGDNLLKYEKREAVLRDTLVSAQKFSSEIKINAQRESEIIIKEAEIKGEEIVGSAINRHKALKEEIRNLKFKRKEIESDIINMLTSLKELIESYRRDDGEFEKIEYIAK